MTGDDVGMLIYLIGYVLACAGLAWRLTRAYGADIWISEMMAALPIGFGFLSWFGVLILISVWPDRTVPNKSDTTKPFE